MQVAGLQNGYILFLGSGVGDDSVEELGGGEDARDPCARVGTCAAKVESTDIFGDVVRAEPGALSEDGFELEGGAVVGIEPGFKITRGEDKFTDEVFTQVGDDGFF
jgi:hypothetical protein